jgi:ABC-type Fe3+/spermidine/putrescine transport system ATPase subunit
VLSIRDLTRTYPGGLRALRGISLDIPPGMFGLLGPNGAGKSTLMKILATLLDPDSGSANLDGLDLVANKDATRRLLGYLPQEFGVYPKMSAVDLLSHLAVMKGIVKRSERKHVLLCRGSDATDHRRLFARCGSVRHIPHPAEFGAGDRQDGSPVGFGGGSARAHSAEQRDSLLDGGRTQHPTRCIGRACFSTTG